MTVWVMYLPLSPAEAGSLTSRELLPLPLDDLPDLSFIRSPVEFRHLLKALNPQAPPETLTRIEERTWRIYRGLDVEDIIAVPLPHAREVAVAEVTGRYRYATGEDGSDRHAIPVTWYEKRIPFSRFRKHKSLLESDGQALREVQALEVRNIIRSSLPHSYNRFAGIQWILGIFFVWRLVMFLTHKLPHLL